MSMGSFVGGFIVGWLFGGTIMTVIIQILLGNI